MTFLTKPNIYFFEKVFSSEEFVLLLFTCFVLYILYFTKNKDFIKYVLVFLLFFFWKNHITKILNESDDEQNNVKLNENISLNNISKTNDNIKDTHKESFYNSISSLQWINLDKPLLNYVNSLGIIKKYDKSILNEIIQLLNDFSRLYYSQIIDKQDNLYQNVTKHRLDIQDLEDIVLKINEKLMSLEFATSHVTFTQRMKIPSKVNYIESLLTKRIRLLKAKRQMIID